MSVSKEYDRFKLLDFNRSIDSRQVNKIKESITKNGYLTSCPIVVDERMNIIDGQHRFTACKEMGLPIFYEVIEDAEKLIIDLNTTQRKWKAKDYIKYYALRNRNENYKNLMTFQKEFNTTYEIAIILATNGVTSGSKTELIRKGQFAFNQAQFEDAAAKLSCIKIIAKELRLRLVGRMVIALLKLADKEEFSWKRMIKQSNVYSAKAYRCNTTDEYYTMLKDIYNFNNRKPEYMIK